MAGDSYALRRTQAALQQTLCNGPTVERGPQYGILGLSQHVDQKEGALWSIHAKNRNDFLSKLGDMSQQIPNFGSVQADFLTILDV